MWRGSDVINVGCGVVCRIGRTPAGGSAGTGGFISAGVAGGVDDGGGTGSVGPSPIQSWNGTNTAYVGCTEGEAVVWSVLITRLSAVVLAV